MRTNIECYIELAPGNKLYTDIDMKIESRRKKLELLGINREFSEYTWDDIGWISSKCNRLFLLRPTSIVGKYTFAFEEALHRIDDITKLRIGTFYHVKAWNIKQVAHNYVYDSELIKRIYIDTAELDQYRRWDLLFLAAWAELYNEEAKSQWDDIIKQGETQVGRRLCEEDDFLVGETRFRGNSSIAYKGLNKGLYGRRLTEYKLIKFQVTRGKSLEVLWDLFKWSHKKLFIYSYIGGYVTAFTKHPIDTKVMQERIYKKYGERVEIEEWEAYTYKTTMKVALE